MAEDGPQVPSDEMALGSVSHLFAQARQGDLAAFSPLWQRFFPRLVGLARRRLAGRRIGGSDAEDAAQAALVSFWKQLNSGMFLNNLRRDSLWNLLAKFTARKVGHQLRDEAAEKRGGGRVLAEAELSQDQQLDQVIGELSPQELDVQASELLEGLPSDLQEMAMLRLLGYSTKEIADEFDCTQRKVQRKLELVRLRWETSFAQS